MEDFVPIQYREFYDVPRIFIVVEGGTSYLFDASFDQALDDYPDSYTVSILPPLRAEELAGSWSSLPSRAIGYLGSVQVSAVHFDQTRRQAIERSFLCSVISSEHATNGDCLTLDGQPIDLDIVKAADLNEGWIEQCEFVTLADGGKRLVTRVDVQKGDEQPVVQRRFGRVGRFSTAA